jgi:hypothetical protein
MNQPETSPLCAPFIERLVDGISPANDAALREHVSSCLWCRRAEQDLLSADPLADALRAATTENGTNTAENNDIFWTSLQARTVKAWDKSQRPPGQRRQRFGIGMAVTVALGAAAGWMLSLGGAPRAVRTTATHRPESAVESQRIADDDFDVDLNLSQFENQELMLLNALLDQAVALESDGLLAGELLAAGDPITGLSDSESLLVLSGTELATLSQQLTASSALPNE